MNMCSSGSSLIWHYFTIHTKGFRIVLSETSQTTDQSFNLNARRSLFYYHFQRSRNCSLQFLSSSGSSGMDGMKLDQRPNSNQDCRGWRAIKVFNNDNYLSVSNVLNYVNMPAGYFMSTLKTSRGLFYDHLEDLPPPPSNRTRNPPFNDLWKPLLYHFCLNSRLTGSSQR